MVDAEISVSSERAVFSWLSLLLGGVTVTLATAAGLLLAGYLSLASIAFLFLLPVVFSAGRDGLWGGLSAAGLATASLNFFFVPPTHTLRVASADNIATLFTFIAVAFVVSSAAERLKLQAHAAKQKAQESALLSETSQALARMTGQSDITEYLVTMLSQCTGSHVQIVTAEQVQGDTSPLSPLDQAAAGWAMAHRSPAGRNSKAIEGADAYYMPMVTGDGEAAAVQFWRSDTRPPLADSQQLFVAAIVARGGDALLRANMLAHQSEREARQRHEALREALLASISHDLRTPLTSIRAGLDALRADDTELLMATRREAERLEQMITNLLDLARVRANAHSADRVPTDLTDVIDAALSARDTLLEGRDVAVSIDPALPLVLADARMLHHMLLNLIDNACKYSGDGAAIAVTASADKNGVTLAVDDHGPGLPDTETGDLFGHFRRGAGSDRVPGNGLGLAVVDGFARAMGLQVTASNRAVGGARFAIHFPAESVRPSLGQGI